MNELRKKIIDRLKQFESDLKAGKEITIRRVEMTPDGPLTTDDKLAKMVIEQLVGNVDDLLESMQQEAEDWPG